MVAMRWRICTQVAVVRGGSSEKVAEYVSTSGESGGESQWKSSS